MTSLSSIVKKLRNFFEHRLRGDAFFRKRIGNEVSLVLVYIIQSHTPAARDVRQRTHMLSVAVGHGIYQGVGRLRCLSRKSGNAKAFDDGISDRL